MNPLSSDSLREELAKRLENPKQTAPEHAAQLLCDATLDCTSPYSALEPEAAFEWWNQCLLDFREGGYPIDPLLPRAVICQVRASLEQLSLSYQLIKERRIDELLEQAHQALSTEGSEYLIPIVYKSQVHKQNEGILALFTRKQGKLYVRLMTRGEGMRLHPLLEERDGKRLYSYSSRLMLLRDQQLFCSTGLLGIGGGPSELGRAWIKQLIAHQTTPSCAQEIYAVFRDVLAEEGQEKLELDYAASPGRSATSLHHLPGLLLRYQGTVTSEQRRRFSFAVKARAQLQVLASLRAGSEIDPQLVRDEIAELNASAKKLHDAGIIDDQDLGRIDELSASLEREIPTQPAMQELAETCPGANQHWEMHPQPAFRLSDTGKRAQRSHEAKPVSPEAKLPPEPSELLNHLEQLRSQMRPTRIAEVYALLNSLPLPKTEGQDPYWDQVTSEQAALLLSSLRSMLQSYGHELQYSAETELPRAILALASAYCIADSLARRLEGDSLKLSGFGLMPPQTDERFFFHRREQTERWQQIQGYFAKRNSGDKPQLFGYYTGKHPWGRFHYDPDTRFSTGSQEHLRYLKQFDAKRPIHQLIARRFVQGERFEQGLQMPPGYDDLHYFAATLRRLCRALRTGDKVDLAGIVSSDQIPVLLRYEDKEQQDSYKLIYCNASALAENEKQCQQRRAEGRKIQKRQSDEYSQQAQRVLFEKDPGSENALLYKQAQLGDLPQAAVHALQKILRLKRNSDYLLQLSELMDFCRLYPLAASNKDVRLVIESVLFGGDKLYTLLREDGQQVLYEALQDFLASQRKRVHGSLAGLDELLQWQILTLDLEQLAPKAPSTAAALLRELEAYPRALLCQDQQTSLALHKAYLYSFMPSCPAELLAHWIEARTLRERLGQRKPNWIEGELLRRIELEGHQLQSHAKQALQELGDFLPAGLEWSNEQGLLCAGAYSVDPLDGHILEDGKPYGAPAERAPQSVRDSVQKALGLERCPALQLGTDQAWCLKQDPHLKFVRRSYPETRQHWIGKGHLGQQSDCQFSFELIDEPWDLPPDMQRDGRRYWIASYPGKFLLIEEPNGDLLVIYDTKNIYDKTITVARYLDSTFSRYLDKEHDYKEDELQRFRREAYKVKQNRCCHVAVRDIAIDGQHVRWQKVFTTDGLPQELLTGHTAFIESGRALPRVLMVDSCGEGRYLLTPEDKGYSVRDLARGCQRVAFPEAPWTALAEERSMLAWEKDGVLQAIDYPYLDGLSFVKRKAGFECMQLPGFFVQARSADDLPKLRTQLLLENSKGEKRLLLRSPDGYDMYTQGPKGSGWEAPNTSAAMRLVLHLAAAGRPLAGLFVLDAVGDAGLLQQSDWESLASLSQEFNQAHGCSALLLQLALRVLELRDLSEAKKSSPQRLAFWSAVDKALLHYAHDSAVPLCLQLTGDELHKLKSAPRPEQARANLRFPAIGGWRTQHLDYIPEAWKDAARSEYCSSWSQPELAAHVKTLIAEAQNQKSFPAPIDLQLRATLERELQGYRGDNVGDRTRIDELKKRRLEAISRLVGNRREWNKQEVCLEAELETSKQLLPPAAEAIGVLLQAGDYQRKPFTELFETCVYTQLHKLPKEELNAQAVLADTADPLAQAVQLPLRRELEKPTPSEVACYSLKQNSQKAIEAHLADLRKQESKLREQLEASANAHHSLREACGLRAADFVRLKAEDVLLLFNPQRPQALLERNPFLNHEDLAQLMDAAIAFMECGWKQSQLEEALQELGDGNSEACAAILAKEQVFDPRSCWWRSLYQYMSGNMLRQDPDQSAVIDRIFRCLEAKRTDPSGEQLQQLYFEFQAGGGKTKLLSAIAALRCLNMGETPVFFSLPNLVDICKRDLKSALSSYFHKRCESIELGLSSELDNAQLMDLVDLLERNIERPACLVMTPEGYQFLQLEYLKSLSMHKADQRISLLDRALSFFEEHAVFLIDEGHRNKDPLLNANIALGTPKAIPAAYRSLQQVAYRWLSKHPKLGLLENSQAALTGQARNSIIRELLHYMLSLRTLDVGEELREQLIDGYLLNKQAPPPGWLLERFESKDRQLRLQAQWIAQLRGLATSILPFTLSQKGMIDHGPSIHTSCEVEVPRDHGLLSASQFEVPDIALALTYQGFLQRGLQSEKQFSKVIRQLKEQAKTQGSDHMPGQTSIEKDFLSWQGEAGIPLRELRESSTKSPEFQKAFASLRGHPEIVLRYVAAEPAGQVSLFQHRLVTTAAGLSYGAKRCISFSATLGMRSKYTYFGDDEAYQEDTAFVAKVMRKVALSKNSALTIDSSSSQAEFIAKHGLGQAAGFLDFGGACGALPSESWCDALLKSDTQLDGCLYAQQQVDREGKIGEKLLFLKLRGQPAEQLDGSDLRKLLRSPELRDKRLLRLFAPEDTVGLDLHAASDAAFIITVGENACLDDLAQALLRARRFLTDVAEGRGSQTVRWIIHEKIALQIRETLGLDGQAHISTQDLLRWTLNNMVSRLQEAIQARAYQEIEGVYHRLLRAQLRGKPASTQRKLFEQCSAAIYKASGYNPFEQWGRGSVERSTREVLDAFNQQLHALFSKALSEIPAWVAKRIDAVITETEQLIKTLPSQRDQDLRARQVQRQHAQAQQRQRQQHRQRQRASKHNGKERCESPISANELSVEKLPYPLDHSYLRPAQVVLGSKLLPENLLLSRDSFLTQEGSNDQALWKLQSAKPMLHILVLKAADTEPLFIALSQDQARSYAAQLQAGKCSEHYEIGLLDLQGHWTHPLKNEPDSTAIRQALCLLNGRLQHPDHLRALMQDDAQGLSKLWQQLEEMHVDAIPSWESVLAYISKESDPLKSIAQSCDTLSISIPKQAPVIANAYETVELKARPQPQVERRAQAYQLKSLDLAELRARIPHERQAAAPKPIEVIRENLPAKPGKKRIVEIPAPSSWWSYLIPGALAFFTLIGIASWRWRARRLRG